LQRPPTLRADAHLLDTVLAEFPPHVKVAVEPRHESWWVPAVEETLRRRRAALCWADRLGRPVTPLWRTADWGYLRLHEGRARPRPGYGRQALNTWLDRITDTFEADRNMYVYFNNDPGGAAIRDAVTLAGLARRRGLDVTRARHDPRRELVH
jgi:uncharacterized protein YecE (DUF72 family)